MYMAMKACARAVAAEMIAACRDDNRLPVMVQLVMKLAKKEVMMATQKWLDIQDDSQKYLLLVR